MNDEMAKNIGFLYLHPFAKERFEDLRQRLADGYQTGKSKFLFLPYETYRAPERQAYLKLKKRSTAEPFFSAHQFGLAVDFVPCKQEGDNQAVWSWPPVDDDGWDFLHDQARTCGLDNPVPWDAAHIEHPMFKNVLQTMKRFHEQSAKS